MHPLLIKTLIAVESTFNPTAAAKVVGSSAYGLMQVTDQARRALSGEPDSKGYRSLCTTPDDLVLSIQSRSVRYFSSAGFSGGVFLAAKDKAESLNPL